MSNTQQPSKAVPKTSQKTADILAEAQRRLESKQQPPDRTPSPGNKGHDWRVAVNRGVFWLSKHWIGVFNAFTALYLLGAMLAPAFLLWSMPKVANGLYGFYEPFCHQYPFRSWYVGGEKLAYPLETAPESVFTMNALASDIGDANRGYKMALCERDIAIYGIMVLTGVAYGIIRRRRKTAMQPLALWLFYIFCVMPMLLDGGLQWLSYAIAEFIPAIMPEPFETVPLMRTLTGGLFGFGLTAILYPYMDEFFVDIKHSLEMKFGW